jgi:SAM-dependent methyltransferase
MFDKIYYSFRFKWQKYKANRIISNKNKLIKNFINQGQTPWSEGYHEFKEQSIANSLTSANILNCFKNKNLPSGYGLNIDERIVEYPWIYSCLFDNVEGANKLPFKKFLDAGSTFNFDYIIKEFKLKQAETTIYTYHPEKNCFWKDRISYVFGDLRYLPFKDTYFDVVVCHSTIEHIDMDNTIYGYDLKTTITDTSQKSYEYLMVIDELLRVLSSNGRAILTFPYGKYERHDFFQQFDNEMLNKILSVFEKYGQYETSFLKYEKTGWKFADQQECDNCISFNPHTGKGKLDDNAAHSRAIACIDFRKK